MKLKNLLLFGTVLLASVLLFASCKSDDAEKEPEPGKEYATHEDIMGRYVFDTEQGEQVWVIAVKTITVNETPAQDYTYKEGILAFAGSTYDVEYNKTNTELSLTCKEDGGKLKMNKKEAPEPEPEPDPDPEYIAIADLYGTYEVTKENKGDSPSPKTYTTNEHMGNLWIIKEEGIVIACGVNATYTYDKNIMKVGEKSYEFDLGDTEGEYVVMWVDGNVMTTLTLTPSNKTCVEDPGVNPEPPTGDVDPLKLYGYADLDGITGGASGDVLHFDNGKLLQEWLISREKNGAPTTPTIIWLSGKFVESDGRGASGSFDIKDTKNLTLIGTDNFVQDMVGFKIVRAENIILRNIKFLMPKDDAIEIDRSHKVWVDHCSFIGREMGKEDEDGACDVKEGSTGVTISWNHFYKTQKTCLIGHSDKGVGTDEALRVTFHHNYLEATGSRTPRVRFGHVHVYNNYYFETSAYGVGSALGAMVLVEHNVFNNVVSPTDIAAFPGKTEGTVQSGGSYKWVSNLTDKTAGFLHEQSNSFINIPTNFGNNNPIQVDENNVPVAYGNHKLTDGTSMYPMVNYKYDVLYPRDGSKQYDPILTAVAKTPADFAQPYQYMVDPIAEDGSRLLTILTGGQGSGAGTIPITTIYGAVPAVDNGGLIVDPIEPPVDPPVDPIDPGTALGGGWSGFGVGDASGSAVIDNNTSITVTSSGKFESGAQSFYYVYKKVTGDFEMTAKISNVSFVIIKNQGIGGLLMTPAIAAGTDMLFGIGGVAGDGLYRGYQRVGTGTAAGAKNGKAAASECHIKLERIGDKYATYFSEDGGATYTEIRATTFTAPLPEELLVGIALSSSSTKEAEMATVSFSDVKINGVAQEFVDE